MKNAIIAFVLIAILVLTGAIIYGVENKTTRQNELDVNLSSAMERSMEILTIDPTYTLDRENDEHLVADFIQSFLTRMNSKSEFKVEILKTDATKGLLSVRVTETYNTVLGKSTVKAERTCILDDYAGNGEGTHLVTFYDDDEMTTALYGVSVDDGQTLPADMHPVNPMKEGETFGGWKLSGYEEWDGIYTHTTLGNIVVTKDLNFVAVWDKDAEDLFTVSFYVDGELFSYKKVNKDSFVGAHNAPPNKDGYVFKGWTGPDDELLSDEKVKQEVVTGHTKYYAVYEEE